MTFKPAFFSITFVLMLDVLLMVTDGYSVLPWADIPMHFFGGFATALLALAIHSRVFSNAKTKQIPVWYLLIFVIGFVMIVGVFWEFHEYILDHTVSIWYGYPISQISLTDTMKDFFDDLFGAFVAFILFKRTVS